MDNGHARKERMENYCTPHCARRIFYYNFPIHDFEACTAKRLLDIVIVMADELTKGKVAVHCHAGHGRTGMVITACLMLIHGVPPEEALQVVRQKRANSVQSSKQIRALCEFHRLFRKSASVLPDSPFSSTSLYMDFTNRVLPRIDARRYGKIPKFCSPKDEPTIKMSTTFLLLSMITCASLQGLTPDVSSFTVVSKNETEHLHQSITNNMAAMAVLAPNSQPWKLYPNTEVDVKAVIYVRQRCGLRSFDGIISTIPNSSHAERISALRIKKLNKYVYDWLSHHLNTIILHALTT
ncbi:dual specificity phosphatase, catalytic domain protein [Dictyocaulus viviparus]|uniref:Dual specificity phosphatase, catalytic domain protein n=1 Tax=Dictyocaulus viviparus TaxID=29172 RepID=A0A0D8XR28_DICVI|nr:dual specificity phosphatase, catalytic domain protein [Dictyocaulus viviparus]